MTKFAPKRQFSQNFLTDVSIARNIAAQLSIAEHDCIFEVGPGKGALTKHLLDSPARRVYAMDLDPRAPEYLASESWSRTTRFECAVGDALRSQAKRAFEDSSREYRKIIGNIPYSITSELLFWAFAQHEDVERVVFMMQREVAKRCVASPGTKDYGILSVATWLYSEAKICFHVQPGSFFPRPEVTSSVVSFVLREQLPMGLPADRFMEFVRAAFSQRRKVMSNSLASWAHKYSQDVRAVRSGVDLTYARAEELRPEELAHMYFSIVGN